MVKTYIPATLKEAMEIRKESSVMPYAGGTDLMVKYKSWSGALPVLPKEVLYIGDLNELKIIEITNEEIIIGSAVKLSTLLNFREIPEFIRQPVRSIGSISIRNLGTMGGNICNASPAGDTLPMLYALDARLELASAVGTRIVDISDFIYGPGKTCLQPDELLTKIIIPKVELNKWGFRKVGSRKANAISKLSVFIAARVQGPSINDIRITFGALGPKIIRNIELERTIVKTNSSQLSVDLEGILDSYRNSISPITDVRSTKDYRSDVAIGIIKDMITKELM